MPDFTSNLAATIPLVENIKSEIINPLMGFLFAVAFVTFLYGVVEAMSKFDTAKVEQGKKHIGWGLFGLFVIVSVNGIINFVQATLTSVGLE